MLILNTVTNNIIVKITDKKVVTVHRNAVTKEINNNYIMEQLYNGTKAGTIQTTTLTTIPGTTIFIPYIKTEIHTQINTPYKFTSNIKFDDLPHKEKLLSGMVNKISEFILYSYHGISYPEVFSFIKEKSNQINLKIMELSEKAKEARRHYKRKWREKNREHIRQYHREWRKKNRKYINERNRKYWERKATEMTKESEQPNLNVPNTHTQENSHKKVCQECGTFITGKKKYCSQKCKQKAYRKNKKK